MHPAPCSHPALRRDTVDLAATPVAIADGAYGLLITAVDGIGLFDPD